MTGPACKHASGHALRLTYALIIIDTGCFCKEGGEVAREAKETMERRLGRPVVSPEKASDYIKPIDATPTQELPFSDMPKKEPTTKKKPKK